MPLRHSACLNSRSVSRATSQRRHRTGVLLLATLFAVLMGVIAMHGLAGHGVVHSSGVHSTLPGVAEAPADGPAGSQGHVHGTSHEGSPDAPASPDGHHGVSGEACLAILCLLIALLLLAVRRGRLARTMVVLGRRPRSRVVLRGRPADPPCLHRLSILRC